MFLFFCKIEIDGFFYTEKEFKLSEFKAKEINTLNNQIDTIQEKSLLIYEIKNGDNLNSLCNQIINHYHFLVKFFECLKKYDKKHLKFFGFYRSSKNIEIEKNLKDELSKLELPVILIRYDDEIFRQNIYYENNEIDNIKQIKLIEEENSKKLDDLKDDIDEIKNMLIGIQNNPFYFSVQNSFPLPYYSFNYISPYYLGYFPNFHQSQSEGYNTSQNEERKNNEEQ